MSRKRRRTRSLVVSPLDKAPGGTKRRTGAPVVLVIQPAIPSGPSGVQTRKVFAAGLVQEDVPITSVLMRVSSVLPVTLLVASQLLGASHLAAQQPADSVKLPAVLRIPSAREIALARSAAPAIVSDSAEIWVLGDRGYEKVVSGTNGYGCIVQRGM